MTSNRGRTVKRALRQVVGTDPLLRLPALNAALQPRLACNTSALRSPQLEQRPQLIWGQLADPGLSGANRHLCEFALGERQQGDVELTASLGRSVALPGHYAKGPVM